jgi:hypothetical protein
MAGSDYTAASGTLNWGAGDIGERVINVPVINDSQTEAGESFRITLSNAAGGVAIEGSPVIDVTITDNDAALPPGPGSGGGGGGGAAGAGLLWLLALVLLAARGTARQRVRAAVRSSSSAQARPAPAS